MKATVENHGTIFLVRPHTEETEDWLHEMVQSDAQWFAGALVVEHRYIHDLVGGMQNAGIEVE